MLIEMPTGGCSGAVASGIVQLVLRLYACLDMVAYLEPRALIERFFLTPDHLDGVRKACQLGADFRARERIELFDPHDGDIA